MALNLAEMVDKAIPSGGVVNCEHLHKLLHVIVHNLTEKELKMDFRCSSDGKTTQPFDKENLTLIHGKVKDLAKMSEEQRRMLGELEGKLNSLEGEVNKVANAVPGSCGKCGKSVVVKGGKERGSSAPVGRSASKRSLTKRPGSKRSLTKLTRSSNTSYKSHSCLSAAERSGNVFGKGNAPGGKPGSSRGGATNLEQVVDHQMKNIHIPELKKWVEAKLKSLPAVDSLPQRIDTLVKEQMNSTVVPDMKKMIEAMISQTQREMGGGAGGGPSSSFPLCISCQKVSHASQVDSQDCLCVIKRKMKNASKLRVRNE